MRTEVEEHVGNLNFISFCGRSHQWIHINLQNSEKYKFCMLHFIDVVILYWLWIEELWRIF